MNKSCNDLRIAMEGLYPWTLTRYNFNPLHRLLLGTWLCITSTSYLTATNYNTMTVWLIISLLHVLLLYFAVPDTNLSSSQTGEFDRLNFILTTNVVTSLWQFQRLDVETGSKTPTLPPPYTFLHKEYLPKHLQMQHVSNEFINLN